MYVKFAWNQEPLRKWRECWLLSVYVTGIDCHVPDGHVPLPRHASSSNMAICQVYSQLDELIRLCKRYIYIISRSGPDQNFLQD